MHNYKINISLCYEALNLILEIILKKESTKYDEKYQPTRECHDAQMTSVYIYISIHTMIKNLLF